MSTTPPQVGLVQFLKSMMGLFVTNDKVDFSKLFVVLILTLSAFGYYHRSDIADFMENRDYEKKFSAYIEGQNSERVARLDASVKTHAQLVYSIVAPDMVGVWVYKPEELRHFRELIHYEGKLPEGTEAKDFQNIGVDKTLKEYELHIQGIPYQSNGLDHAVSSITNTRYYAYSCPLFNSRGSYHGIVGMYWKDMPSPADEKQYYVMCTQAARAIGANL